MKIAIYTISKNESHNVEQFMKAAAGVPVYILDTGSTDNTVELLNQHGAIVQQKIISPWRFDTARNEALALVPEDVDVCISIDMDEVLEDRWKEKLLTEWKGNIGSYLYIPDWLDEQKTQPMVQGPRTKIHARHGFTWTRPVHEMITPKEGTIQSLCETTFLVKHYQDKNTRNYIPLLNKIIEENPNDSDAWLQRAAENLEKKNYIESIDDYREYIKLNLNDETPFQRHRKSICYMAIAECFYHLNDHSATVRYYMKAAAEHPEAREPWVHLGFVLSSMNDIPLAYGAAMRAIAIKESPYYVTKDMMCWNDVPNKIANDCFTKLMKGIK